MSSVPGVMGLDGSLEASPTTHRTLCRLPNNTRHDATGPYRYCAATGNFPTQDGEALATEASRAFSSTQAVMVA